MTEVTDFERCIAIQQIQELQARRCYALDHQDWLPRLIFAGPA